MDKRLSYIAILLTFGIFNGSLLSTSYTPPSYCPSADEVKLTLTDTILSDKVGDVFSFKENQFRLVYKTSKISLSEDFYIIQIPPVNSFSDGCFYEIKTVITAPNIVTFGINLESSS